MASKKETSSSNSGKAASRQVVQVPVRLSRSALESSAASRDPRQLMREAAWSRMFGRTESKNPFTR